MEIWIIYLLFVKEVLINMGAKNKVIAGDYEGCSVGDYGIYLKKNSYNHKDILDIDCDTIERYEVIDEKTQKSASSAILRGFAGAVLLGGVGLLAGLSAKSKGTHILTLYFNDGKKSLIEINDRIYKNLMMKLF